MGTNRVYVKRDIRAERLQAASALRRRMAIQATYMVRLLSSLGRADILVDSIAIGCQAEGMVPCFSTVRITTGGACHLEFPLVENADARERRVRALPTTAWCPVAAKRPIVVNASVKGRTFTRGCGQYY